MRIQFNQTGEPSLVKHADGAVTVAIPIDVKRNRGGGKCCCRKA